MSSDLETLRQHEATLRRLTEAARGITLHARELQTELDRSVRLLRQLNREAAGHRPVPLPLAAALALLGGLLGALATFWAAQLFLGR